MDTDLKKFEAELQQTGTLIPNPTHKEEKKEKKSETVGKSHKKKYFFQRILTQIRTTVDPSAPHNPRVLSVDIDMPIDPNEPTYCVCGRVIE